ncbi:hypothetical protein EVAR_19415_1 [Eumeta japonica]|uniref:Uncharacterized protein n=1 Tax=Eumeta variegata TaxID=151549 RepID=A0A4C1TRK7_EUMVA|nr:hypothetical protein EVAR_19415_1 [Eumeta japonica]
MMRNREKQISKEHSISRFLQIPCSNIPSFAQLSRREILTGLNPNPRRWPSESRGAVKGRRRQRDDGGRNRQLGVLSEARSVWFMSI